MTRLVTERVTKAEATQRAGRAGRVAPGVCYRLWTKGEDGGLLGFPPAEIEAADLAGLALELAQWGTAPEELAFLTPPPDGAMSEARGLLAALGALEDGRITEHGRALVALPLHPRLGHMLLRSGKGGALIAALLAERDVLRGAPVDLALRVAAVKSPQTVPFEVVPAALTRVRDEARRLADLAPADQGLSIAECAALAYPDRIGIRRRGDAPRYVLSGGKGVVLAEDDPLAGQRLIVATDTDGDPREARVRQAIAISEAEVRGLFSDRIFWEERCEWSRRDGRVVARRQERLGALVLDGRVWKDAPPEAVARAMCDGIRQLGLRLSPGAKRLQTRVELVRSTGGDLPDFTDDALLQSLEDWLASYLAGVRDEAGWRAFDATEALRARLSWEQMQALDRAAPAHFETPLGRKIAIDYGGEAPEISLRLQEMFGQTTHPMVAGQALRVTLLSPAGRPVQTTMDLPGFWASSYNDVRKDMRGRYPKHPWPEDPTRADPTLRAKRRG